LRIETLRRFKGQAAAAVVLTEIDFEAFTDLERRMLFVGMTRASMHLELVMSDRAEDLLRKRLS
jgi:superfamily I DNA/RNA helicase